MCETTGCVCEVVKLIDCIQKKHRDPENVVESCDKPFLGERPCPITANTRPFILYNCEGRLWRAFFCHSGCVGRSPFFRVEKIEDCCATLRVLKPKRSASTTQDSFCDREFEATESFITIDLGCTCAIQCLKDTYVDLCPCA